MLAVIFDADGTLLDSLPPHVEFCRAMAAQQGDRCAAVLAALPEAGDLAGCRALSAAPMDNFLRKAGFAEELVPPLVAEYEASFADGFPVAPFRGTGAVLAALRRGSGGDGGAAGGAAAAAAAAAAGLRLAVVSSNTAANVRRGLGSALCAHFEIISGIDNGPRSKQDAIADCLRRMGLDSAGAGAGAGAGEGGAGVGAPAVVYVGDTAKDCACARANGLAFVGVDFGFEELSTAGLACPVARTMEGLGEMLIAWKEGRGLPSLPEQS
jgi:phosphoglycolate phosphatase